MIIVDVVVVLVVLAVVDVIVVMLDAVDVDVVVAVVLFDVFCGLVL